MDIEPMDIEIDNEQHLPTVECQVCCNDTTTTVHCGCTAACCPECLAKWVDEQKSSLCTCRKRFLTYKQLRFNTDMLNFLNTCNFWKKTNRFAGRPYTFSAVCCGDFVSSGGACAKCAQITCCRCLQTNVCPTPTRCSSTLYSTLKNCPNCLVYMEKRDGCNEMFCSACFTSFSYSSGTLCKYYYYL